MAVYGFACIFLYIIPAIVFLLPTSLASAEIASGWSGGVYRWVSEASAARSPSRAEAADVRLDPVRCAEQDQSPPGS